MDAGDFRGTGLSIIYVVTSTRGEGVEILRRQKTRGRLTPPPKIVQRGLHWDHSLTTPDRHPAPLWDYCESAREPAGGIFPLDALVFPPHLKVCLQGAGLNLI